MLYRRFCQLHSYRRITSKAVAKNIAALATNQEEKMDMDIDIMADV